MRKRSAILGFLIGAAAAAAAASDPPLAKLRGGGDVGALSEAEFDTFAGCIARGDARCIAVVGTLRPSGNAARSEGVTIALSRALRTNPAAVLRLRRLPDGHRLEQFCADNDIEPSRAAVAAFRREAVRALRQVRDPRLGGRRDACLGALVRAPG